MPPVPSVASAMAVTGTDTDARDYTTASWTPTVGKWYLLVFGQLDLGSAKTTPTVSGNSMVWTQFSGTGGGATEPNLLGFLAYADPAAATGVTTISGVVSSGQTADGAIWGIVAITDLNPRNGVPLRGLGEVSAIVDTATPTTTVGQLSSDSITLSVCLAYDNASTTGPALTIPTGGTWSSVISGTQAAGGDGMSLTVAVCNTYDGSADWVAVAANDRMLAQVMELCGGSSPPSSSQVLIAPNHAAQHASRW